MVTNEELSLRLREERKRLGASQAEMGSFGGVNHKTQGNYESGARSPDCRYLVRVADAGVDVLYVVTGRREPKAQALVPSAAVPKVPPLAPLQDTPQPYPQSAGHGLPMGVLIPRMGDAVQASAAGLLVEADISTHRPLMLPVLFAGGAKREYQLIPRQAGGGRPRRAAEDEVADLAGVIAMERNFLRNELGRDGGGFVTMTVDGDSMAPVLCHGATIVLDTQVNSVRDSGLYAVSIGLQQVVRRLVLRMDGGLRIRMDNPAYASAEEQCSADQAQLVKVLGLVVWPRVS